MPPSALKRYLQFPKTVQPEEEDDAEDAKRSAATQQQPAIKSIPSPSMTQPNGVAAPAPRTVNVTAPKYGGLDDQIQEQMDAYKTTMDQRPARDIGAPPRMPQLPDRPQASPWEAIPQILAGAGNVLSAGSNHPQDYLTPLMSQQKGRRDEVYADRVAQAHNMFQNEREQYSDKLMRYSMDLREHEQRLNDLKSHIGMLTEQKYLTGQKTPQDMMDTQKREGYRAQFEKFDLLKDAEEHARQLKATRPEDAALIESVLQGKRVELQGRPQGIVEMMTNTPPGRGLLEAPQGRTSMQPVNPEYQKATERSNADIMGEQKRKISNPTASDLEEYRRVTGNPKATLAEYVERLKAGQKYREGEKADDGKEPFKKKGIASRLQEELQGGGSRQFQEWARNNPSKD